MSDTLNGPAIGSMINPKYLRAFLTVAETGSVIRSSERIRRAQSAVTRSIKELENSLGVPLFERRTHGMLMTEFGRVLLARVHNAFDEMETARAGIEAMGPKESWNDHAPVFTLSLSRQRLLAFVELVEQRHMGAVAESLSISQPAVSQALREIEVGVSTPLVSRTPAGIKPTGPGLLLAMHIRRALAEIRAAETEIASLHAGASGNVTIGTMSLGRNRLLPRAIVKLNKTYPDLTVTTVEGSFEYLSMRLRTGDIDFILGGLRPPEHVIGLNTEVVTEDRLSLIVRSQHPLLRKRSVGYADVEKLRWILPPRGSSTRQSLESVMRERGMREPRVMVETADVAITRGILLESDMITAASPHLFQHDFDTRDLAILPLDLPPARRGIGIIQRTDSQPSIAGRLLMDSIRVIGRL